MREQLRAYWVAFELAGRKRELRDKRSRFQQWLVDDLKESPDDARKAGEQLEEDLWKLQEGGFKWSRFIFSIPLMIAIALTISLWIVRSNEFANFVGLWGIGCLVFGGLAAFARFSDLFPKSYIERLRILLGLSRNDLIGLLGTAGIVATTAASYFRFIQFADRVTSDNQEVTRVLNAILRAVQK